MINKFRETISNTITQILLLAFMIFIFAPFEIYLSNKGYFFFEGTEMLGTSVFLFVLCVVILELVMMVLQVVKPLLYRVVQGMLFGGTIALYIQGNWDVTDYGAWNGSEIDWSQYRVQMVLFGVIFLALVIAGAVSSLKKYSAFCNISKIISICLTLVLIVTLGTLLLKKDGLSKEKEFIATAENELQLSKNQNMIILVLDAYDSGAFSKIMSDNRGYEMVFKDFTYYPDTLSGYSSTDMSVPQIITGLDYKNDQLFGDYLDEGYKSSRLINWLDENGWEKDIYFDGLMPQGEDGFGIDNSRQLKRVVNNRKELMRYMYTMVLFRYMPQPIKNHFYFYADNIKSNLNSVRGEYEPYSASNMQFADVIERLTVDRTDNVFQYIHIEGAHEPFNITSEFTVSESETSYEEECEGVLEVVSRLLSSLKEADIYDNTIIMVMSDHGYYNERQNPLLLVKGYNEHHDYLVSDATVSYYDLQDAYIKLLTDMTSGASAFDDIGGNHQRKRLFRYVPWNTHLNFDTYSGDIEEVYFGGNAADINSLNSEGVMYQEPMAVTVK